MVDERKTEVTEPNDVEEQIKDAAINRVTSNVEIVSKIEKSAKDKVTDASKKNPVATDITETATTAVDVDGIKNALSNKAKEILETNIRDSIAKVANETAITDTAPADVIKNTLSNKAKETLKTVVLSKISPEPASMVTNTNSINDIDKWVDTAKTKLSENTTVYTNITLKKNNNVNIPPQLAEWQIYNTSDNNNDCMIHALLIDCSLTFRQLGNKVKETIARKYRIGPFLEIVINYYKAHPEIIVNPGGQNKNLEGEDRIIFLTNLINGTDFLRQEFLIPICYYYNINIMIYVTNRPGEANRKAINSNVVFEFVPETDLIENAQTIVMHNSESVHFSAMSSKEKKFIMPYDQTVKIKTEMDNLIRKEQPDATPECNYNREDIFTDIDNTVWIVKEIVYPSTYGKVICSGLTIVNTNGNVLDNVPLDFFRKVGNNNTFDYKRYKETMQQEESSDDAALAKKKQEEDAKKKEKAQEDANKKEKAQEDAKKKQEEEAKKKQDADTRVATCQINYYKCLDVQPNATNDDIKRAYKTLAGKFHTDNNSFGKEAIQMLNDAKEVLTDSDKRKIYDKYYKKNDHEFAIKMVDEYVRSQNLKQTEEAEKKAQEEAAQKEAAQKEAAQKEAEKKAQEEAAQKEAAQKEAAQKEAAEKNPSLLGKLANMFRGLPKK